MTISVANVLTTETFSAWLGRTNTIATIISQNAVTVDTTGAGSLSTGNAVVNGFFGANTLVAFNGIAGGTLATGNTLNLLSNTAFRYLTSNIVTVTSNSITSNLIVSTNGVQIVTVGGIMTLGGTTLNINSTTTNVTSPTLNANTIATFTGNTSFKANATFTSFTISGNDSVTTLLSNTTNTVFVSNTNFSNSIIVGGIANVNQLNVRGAVTSNIAGNLRIEGSVSIGGNLAYAGTTGGDIIPSANDLFNLGNTTNRFASVFSNSIIGTTVNTTNLIVTGSTSFANNLLPSSNNTFGLGNTTAYWNQSFVSNTNSNNVIVSNIAFLSAGLVGAPSITFSGNTDTGLFRSATATLAVSAAGTQKMTVNATTVSVNAALSVSNTTVVTGNASFSNTITVTGNATFSNTLTVAGATTLSSNVATAGTILINATAHQFANTFTFNNSTVAANVDTVSASTYRSFEYLVQLSDVTVTPNRYHLTKISIIYDGGITTYATEYGTVFNVSSLGSFNSIVNGGNIALQLTPATANVVVKFVRTSIVP